MWIKIKTAITTIYSDIKTHILDMFSFKKTVERNIPIKKYETRLLNIDETTYNYRILYSDSRKIIDIEELNTEVKNIKKLINLKNSYIRINAEMLCHFESINALNNIQTKTYGMFYDDYEINMLNILKDIELLSEKYDITFISEISFNITKYNKNYKLTLKEFENLTKNR